MRKPKKVPVFKTGKTWKGKNALTGEAVLAVGLSNVGVRTELRENGTYEVFNAAGKIVATFNAPKPFIHK